MKYAGFALLFLLLAMVTASTALAQSQRTFVASYGSDANPCSRTAPCRNFAQAISQTNAAGEVIVLDSAGYGPVTITRAVSIIAPPGVYAGISVVSDTGAGIAISTAASDTVVLRGLTINFIGLFGGGNATGILFNTGGTLHVENCVVSGFLSSGIAFRGSGALFVKDTICRGNFFGIEISPPQGGPASASIFNARLEANVFVGLFVNTGARVSIRNSVASGSGVGLQASASSGGSELNVENCLAANNARGISAQGTGSAIVRVSGCTVTDNFFSGFAQFGTGVLLSRGNNKVQGNGGTEGTVGSYNSR